MIETHVYSVLSGAPAITAIVGSRIYPTYPDPTTGTETYLIYSRESTEVTRFLDLGTSSIITATFSLEGIGDRFAEVNNLMAAVFDTMSAAHDSVILLCEQTSHLTELLDEVGYRSVQSWDIRYLAA